LVLTEAAFVLWVLNCLIVSALAHFVGWGIAFAIVAGGWTMIGSIGFIGDHFVDREKTKGLPLHEILISYASTVVQMSCVLAAILIFPIAYFGILAHGRYEAKKAARAIEKNEADLERSED
jgi:hypothetical protein